MAKSETISTAAKPDDLDKAYASAGKALSVLGIKMATKKPDPAKLGPAMTKSKKKAEFKLYGDTKLLKLTVECDSMVNTLGIMDVAAERDAQKRLVILKSLLAAGLITKADVEAAEKEMGPDPKVVANLEREIAAAKKRIADTQKISAGYAGLKDYDAVSKFPAVLKELRDQGAKEYATENFDFLDAVKAKMARPLIVQNFIAASAATQVNLPAPLQQAIMAGQKEPADAVAEIKKLISSDTLVRLKKAKDEELKAVIATVEKQLAGLMETKKKLGIK